LRVLPPYPWEGIIEDYFRVAAHSDPPLCSSAVAIMKNAIESVRGISTGITSGEDLLTWSSIGDPLSYRVFFGYRCRALEPRKSNGSTRSLYEHRGQGRRKFGAAPQRRSAIACTEPQGLYRKMARDACSHFPSDWPENTCLKEICSSLRYRNINIKLFFIGSLTCLPMSVSQGNISFVQTQSGRLQGRLDIDPIYVFITTKIAMLYALQKARELDKK